MGLVKTQVKKGGSSEEAFYDTFRGLLDFKLGNWSAITSKEPLEDSGVWYVVVESAVSWAIAVSFHELIWSFLFSHR